MNVAELPREPDRGAGIECRGVGDQLAQMPVVGPAQLGFDRHPAKGARVAADDVRAAARGALFQRRVHETQPDRLAEGPEIVGLGEPPREIRALARPDVPDRDARESSGAAFGHPPGSPDRSFDGFAPRKRAPEGPAPQLFATLAKIA